MAPVTGGSLNDDSVGKIGIAVSPSTLNRLFGAQSTIWRRQSRVDSALFRELDKTPPKPTGGISISQTMPEQHGAGQQRAASLNGWHFDRSRSNCANLDRAYDVNTATYMTLDAGKTWVPVKARLAAVIITSFGSTERPKLAPVPPAISTVVPSMARKTWSSWYNPAHRAGLSSLPLTIVFLTGLAAKGQTRWSRRQHLVALSLATPSVFATGNQTVRLAKAAPLCPDPDNATFMKWRPPPQPTPESSRTY